MAKKYSLKRRRFNLYKLKPYCYWCGKKVWIRNPDHPKGKKWDEATLDHLDHKFDRNGTKEIFQAKVAVRKTVLSCRKCNFERGNQNIKNTPYHLLDKYSKQGMYKESNYRGNYFLLRGFIP